MRLDQTTLKLIGRHNFTRHEALQCSQKDGLVQVLFEQGDTQHSQRGWRRAYRNEGLRPQSTTQGDTAALQLQKSTRAKLL